jgi:hypothetical protein
MRMSMDTVPIATLEDIIRKCSPVDLFSFICHLSLQSDSRVPSDFLSSFEDVDKIFCWRVILNVVKKIVELGV